MSSRKKKAAQKKKEEEKKRKREEEEERKREAAATAASEPKKRRGRPALTEEAKTVALLRKAAAQAKTLNLDPTKIISVEGSKPAVKQKVSGHLQLSSSSSEESSLVENESKIDIKNCFWFLIEIEPTTNEPGCLRALSLQEDIHFSAILSTPVKIIDYGRLYNVIRYEKIFKLMCNAGDITVSIDKYCNILSNVPFPNATQLFDNSGAPHSGMDFLTTILNYLRGLYQNKIPSRPELIGDPRVIDSKLFLSTYHTDINTLTQLITSGTQFKPPAKSSSKLTGTVTTPISGQKIVQKPGPSSSTSTKSYPVGTEPKQKTTKQSTGDEVSSEGSLGKDNPKKSVQPPKRKFQTTVPALTKKQKTGHEPDSTIIQPPPPQIIEKLSPSKEKQSAPPKISLTAKEGESTPTKSSPKTPKIKKNITPEDIEAGEFEPKTALTSALEVLAPWFWKGGENVLVPVECMTAPPQDWMCREVNQDHVDELYQSMKNNPGATALAEPNGLVIIDEQLANSALQGDVIFEDLLGYMTNHPAYTYHGEHRRRACTLLHNEFPKNKNFKGLKCAISIVPNLETIDEYLLALGLGINNLGDIRKKISWMDTLWRMSTKYHQKMEVDDEEPPLSWWGTFWPNRYWNATEQKKQKNFINLAKMDLEIIKKIKILCERSEQGLLNKKVVRGKEVAGRGKPIQSINKLQWIFGLPDYKINEYLDLLIAGIHNISDIQKKADKFKSVEDAKTIVLADLEMTSWKAAIKKYGEELEVFANKWAKPLKLAKCKPSSSQRPKNFEYWLTRTTSQKEEVSQSLEGTIIVNNPVYKCTHGWYPSNIDRINNLISNGNYGLWVIDPPNDKDNQLAFYHPLPKLFWQDIFLKIQTVDTSDDRTIIMFYEEHQTQMMYDLAHEFKYKIQTLYWLKTNVVVHKVGQFVKNVTPIAVFMPLNGTLQFDKLPLINNNYVAWPALTSFLPNDKGEPFCEYQKPWQLYFKLILPFYHPDMKIIELCCGTSPVSKVAALLGCDSLHIDVQPESLVISQIDLESFFETHSEYFKINDHSLLYPLLTSSVNVELPEPLEVPKKKKGKIQKTSGSSSKDTDEDALSHHQVLKGKDDTEGGIQKDKDTEPQIAEPTHESPKQPQLSPTKSPVVSESNSLFNTPVKDSIHTCIVCGERKVGDFFGQMVQCENLSCKNWLHDECSEVTKDNPICSKSCIESIGPTTTVESSLQPSSE